MGQPTPTTAIREVNSTLRETIGASAMSDCTRRGLECAHGVDQLVTQP